MSEGQFVDALREGFKNLEDFRSCRHEVEHEVERLDQALREHTKGVVQATCQARRGEDTELPSFVEVVFSTSKRERPVFILGFGQCGWPVLVSSVTAVMDARVVTMRELGVARDIDELAETLKKFLRTSTCGRLVRSLEYNT